MALEKELEFFQTIRKNLLERGEEGKFALIKGNEHAGTFSTEQLAFEEGVRRWGNSPFLVIRVTKGLEPKQEAGVKENNSEAIPKHEQ